MGSHICGKIGRNLLKIGITLPRITGLDPAGPCFYEKGLMPGLSSNDAKFVDVIHTNPGTLGRKGRIGHVDFYPNGSDDAEYSKGCKPFLKFADVMLKSAKCSHSRAYKYYAETVIPGNEYNFLPKSCVLDDTTINCEAKNYPMGFAVNATYPKGKYFLKANEDCPFGQDIKKMNNQMFCSIFEKL